jgi:DNA (cytosine-5)-methyltransferase 1
MTLTVGSLFSGIGGLDLGLERAGMKVIWQSEIDEFACKVLKKHWPEVVNHGDIKQIDWGTVERPDVICGGYPCQPFSTAGKRKGTDDPRHLWPWVRESISALQPRYAVLENVRGHLSLGGLQVIGELAEIGYDAEWRVVSAAGVGAPHRRDRLIIVAYPEELFSNGSDNNTRERLEPKTVSKLRNGGGAQDLAYPNDARGGTPESGTNTDWSAQVKEWENVTQFGISRRGANVANTNSEQLGQRGQQENARQTHRVWQHNGSRQTGYDGWQWWEVEPDVGRVANGVPDRVDRLRGLGNAVVPQVAEYIGRLITTIG